jgi:hypothetical protein
MKALPKNVKILTIKKIRLSGKWIEFWFYENDIPPMAGSDDGYQLSTKLGTILDLLDEGEYESLYNDGLVGRQLLWAYKAPNWEVKTFHNKDNYRTWLGKNIHKRSNKPFKNGEKVDIPMRLLLNEQSGKVGFLLSDSIVDCHQCELLDNT